MSEKNINDNTNVLNSVKKAKPRLGLLKAGNLFFTGLGICFLFAYPGLCYIMKENEQKFNKELNSLKSLVEKPKPIL
jgi:hypothetical protein